MVCVDASAIIATLLPEDLSVKADALFRRWRADGERLVAPPILFAEVPSTLRRAVFTGRSTPAEAREALESFLDMPVEVHDDRQLQHSVWAWGERLNTARLYDMYYVAVAEALDCDLWVIDKKLVNLVGPHSRRVRWVGDAEDALET